MEAKKRHDSVVIDRMIGVIDSDFWFVQTEHLWNFPTSVCFYDTENDC